METLASTIIDIARSTPPLKTTFCFMWMGKIRRALAAEGAEIGESHSIPTGQRSYFTGPDGVEYVVTVEPR